MAFRIGGLGLAGGQCFFTRNLASYLQNQCGFRRFPRVSTLMQKGTLSAGTSSVHERNLLTAGRLRERKKRFMSAAETLVCNENLSARNALADWRVARAGRTYNSEVRVQTCPNFY
jgi:hypothetical protein